MRLVTDVEGEYFTKVGKQGAIRQRAEGMVGPVLGAEPCVAVRLLTQRVQDVALVFRAKAPGVAIEEHSQRVFADQNFPERRAVHGQPGMKPSQVGDNAAVAGSQQRANAAEWQRFAIDEYGKMACAQILGDAAVCRFANFLATVCLEQAAREYMGLGVAGIQPNAAQCWMGRICR